VRKTYNLSFALPFNQKTGIGCNVSFLTNEEIANLLSKKDKSTAVVLLGEESYNTHKTYQDRFDDKIVLGHLSTEEERFNENNFTGESVFYLIRNELLNPSNAFALKRFIISPDYGHSLLNEKGFIPKLGDNWQRTPTLLVYATENLREKLAQCLKSFSNREGIQVELNIRSEDSIEKTVALIAKSNAKQYLPDIVLGSSKIENYTNLYVPSKNNRGTISASLSYISNTTQCWHSAQRLVTAVEKSWAK
jgi:MarR-like DNA-binding transcriptional regulator SgrR of sgrS sRNA